MSDISELKEALAALRAIKPANVLIGIAIRAKIIQLKQAIRWLEKPPVVPAEYLNEDYKRKARNRAMRWFRNKALTHELPYHIARKGDLI